MHNYIALLRGINVSGQKVIQMEKLKKAFEKNGFDNVKTYIQSGNVLFESTLKSAAQVDNLVQELILKEFGFEVPVTVIEYEEVDAIIQNNPYLEKHGLDSAFFHVTILSAPPKKELLKQIVETQYLPDQFAIHNNIVYLYCPTGYGRTKLSNNFFEKKLKVNATTRNWKTMLTLQKMIKEI